MALVTIWFILIAVLWSGYFILEGFDFGVGILLPVLGKNEVTRRVMINTIGPVWDGNEVWVLVAGGATFAAFPEWYATLFSGFYLPLLLILAALIIRGVAFEYRGKRPEAAWKRRFDACIFAGSVIPAFLWGVAFANITAGVPIGTGHEYAGTLFDLLSPYALLGGATTLALFTTHGALFVSLKTAGDIKKRAQVLAGACGGVAVLCAAGFLTWTALLHRDTVSIVLSTVAAVLLVAALVANRFGRDGWAFAAMATTIAATTAALFVALFPNVMPSTLGDAYSLTIHNAASTPYTLKIMTVVAAIFTPLVIGYQGWTYWVFRKRLSVNSIPR